MIENHQIVASLYKKELIEVKEWLQGDQLEGAYTNKILIIYDTDQYELEESQRKLLENILKAIGLQISDIQRLNLQHQEMQQFWQINRVYQPQKIIGFGISPRSLGLVVRAIKYRTFSFQEIPILFSDTLAMIEKEVSLKKKLWVALQQMFEIKK